MRDIFNKKPKYQSLTQGSIITGCVATNYCECDVWGCIITARCDLSNIKIDTVHYLPIVSFKDWLKKEVVDRIRVQWSLALKKKLADRLHSKKVADSFLDKRLSEQDFERIVHTYFNNSDAERVLKDYYLWKKSDLCPISFILSTKDGEGILKSEIDKLIKHDYRAFYLIEDWESPNDSLRYKIILLSDIKTLSIQRALQLPDGITEDALSEDDFKNNAFARTKDNSGFYLVDTELKSPYIEHIIQRFVNNFSRIGVEDLPRENVSAELVEYSKEILR